MATETKIEWCDHTFNGWRGCEHATLRDGSEHPGCAHCYAETMSKRNPKTLGVWGAGGTRVRGTDEYWKLPEKWNRQAHANGVRARVFALSLGDVFEDWQGPILGAGGAAGALQKSSGHFVSIDDLRRDLFALIDRTPWLDWLLLTKRPQNIRRMWPAVIGGDVGTMYRPNVWLISSISDQASADVIVPELLRCRDMCPVLGLSAEPLVGPVDLVHTRESVGGSFLGTTLPGISWVIIGGESGPGAREFDFDWAHSIIHQCRAAKVKVFMKQVGSKPVFCGHSARGISTTIWGPITDGKGGVLEEWPLDLRVREYPAQKLGKP